MRVAGLILAAALVACGGSAKRPGKPVANAAGDAAPSMTELVLYRDGALVRERHDFDAGKGRSTLVVPLPRDVDADDLLIRVVSGGGQVISTTVREPRLLPGEYVEIRDGDRKLRGKLADVAVNELVLVDDQGAIHAVLDPRHIVRAEGEGAPARRGAEILVESAEAATVGIELVYVTRGLRWRADYTLVMDTRVGMAQLHGNLGIDNTTGLAWQDATVTLLDSDRPVKLAGLDSGAAGGGDGTTSNRKAHKVADPTKPRAEQPQAVAAPETPRTALPFPVDVAMGAQAVALLGGVHELPARATLVFDPVGEERNLTGKEPHKLKDYGLDRKSTAVSQSFDIDLKKAKIPDGLPAGSVRLVERAAGGALTPLGESRIFERAGSGTDADQVSPTTSIAVGRAGHVEGKRVRREYTLDEDGKRLIEEFEITLTSTADHPVEVTVREHLYRGMNWTLPYHNVGAGITKEGPQKVAMRTTVPANGKARVVYRIIYTW